jgi:succinate-semialdehyde dehydrogenase/glutarate-semialdehyde dehydrogenase
MPLITARLLTGARQLTLDGRAKGNFYARTALADVTPQMRMTCEETFGSVIAVTAFETDDEVIERANSTQYGLAAYLYTRDLSDAILPSFEANKQKPSGSLIG